MEYWVSRTRRNSNIQYPDFRGERRRGRRRNLPTRRSALCRSRRAVENFMSDSVHLRHDTNDKMNESSDWLRAWVQEGSEDAFAHLVARHIDLVYSVAHRRVGGDAGLAADVTQTVFADLARKARALRAEGSLAGWLHRHTCYVAATALRGELRRRHREQTAAAMHALENSSDSGWSRLAPLLDDAVDALGDADRRAILLRFYERRDLRSIGSILNISDDAAQKRVTRALEKLRNWLARRGVTSTTAALTVLLGAHSVTAAPAGLAVSVTAGALAAGTTAGTGAVTLFELMTHAKTKFAVAAAAAAIVATPVVWQETVIANTRTTNRALAAGLQTRAPARAQPVAVPVAAREGDDAEAEHEELDRLRSEIASLNSQLQHMREARLAAAPASGGSPVDTPRSFPPGYVSLRDARDVGAATPEAMFQSFAWAIRAGDTNRMLQLLDISGESAADEVRSMVTELPREAAKPEFEREAANMGFRAVRQVPLQDGDTALVMDVYDQGRIEAKRTAMRVRRAGNEWRLVIGKNGPDEVKLDEEFLRD